MDTEASTTRCRLGYARVSTVDRDEALQTRALTAVGIDAIVIDHGVSAKTSRPRLEAKLDQAQRGDAIVVYSLSRLSRGMTHLIELGEQFEHDGSDWSVSPRTSTQPPPPGRFTFRLLSALAAMERELTIERTHAGLEAARRRPRRWQATSAERRPATPRATVGGWRRGG